MPINNVLTINILANFETEIQVKGAFTFLVVLLLENNSTICDRPLNNV